MAWPVPDQDRWDQTIAQSHDILAYADLLVDGDVAASTYGNDALQLDAATVHVSAGTVERTADLTLWDRDSALVPVVEKGLIIQGKCEVRLWQGVRYHNWTPLEAAQGLDVVWLPMFTGPITQWDLRRFTSQGAVKLECSDRMWYVQRAFSDPYVVRAGTGIDDAIISILRAKVPPLKLDFNIPNVPETTPLLIADEQSDPSALVQQLANSAGWHVFADQMGAIQADTEPVLSVAVVAATYREGPGGALVEPVLTGSVDQVHNTWVVKGSAPNDSSAEARAKVIDDDPTSPTYVQGTWDENPRFISAPVCITDAQCRRTGETYRARDRGIGDLVQASVFPDPSRERGDVVQITGGIVDRLIISDAFDHDLFGGGSPQVIVGRSTFVDDAGSGGV